MRSYPPAATSLLALPCQGRASSDAWDKADNLGEGGPPSRSLQNELN